MRRASLQRVSLAAIICLGAGCSSAWQRVEPEAPVALEPRQQFQVWSDGTERTWHALRVTDSTVSGVPFTEQPECDSCRQELPRTEVDSLRVGNRMLEPFGLVVLGAALAAGLGLLE